MIEINNIRIRQKQICGKISLDDDRAVITMLNNNKEKKTPQ